MGLRHAIPILLLTGVTFVSSAQIITIRDFRQGLIHVSSRGSEIYEAGNSFPYAENGVCVANHERQRCMWYGFEFSYKSSRKTINLECSTTFRNPITIVNPERVLGSSMTKLDWPLELSGEGGYFINPQYTLGTTASAPDRSETVCKFEGQEVLKFSFTVTPAMRSQKSFQ